MIITDIIEVNVGRSKKKSAYKIYIDDDYAFLLYRQDIKVYQLETSTEITSLLYDKIIEETVYRRAKQKALAILKYMDKTEKELYTKLKDAYYTDEIALRTIEYLKGYSYINDERYASYYIRLHKNTKSKLAIKTKLKQKGINKDVLEKISAIEYDIVTNDMDPEILAINKAILKKCKDISNLNWEDKQRIIASLYRKGFDLDKVYKSFNS
jgi:regulatory protein